MLDIGGNYFIRVGFSIFLARLLTPDDYSLIGITFIFFSIAEVFVTSGMGQAYINKTDATEDDVSTIFTLNLGISLAIYILFWFSAPFIAEFFERTELLIVLRLLSCVVILNGINIIQVAHIRRTLNFRLMAKINILAIIISGSVGVFLAYHGYSYWSLVVQQILNKIFLTMMYFLTSSLKIRFRFSLGSFKVLFAYSSWLLINGLLTRVFDNLYRGIIAKVYPSEQLGLYDKGNQFPSLVYQQIWWSIGAVAFPVYSRLKNDKTELEKSLARFVRLFYLIAIPLLCILYYTSDSFVYNILTDKWKGSIPYIKLFCFVGFVHPIYSFINQYLQALGRTKMAFIFIVILNLMRVTNVTLLLEYGIEQIIIGEVFVLGFNCLLLLGYISARLDFDLGLFFGRLKDLFTLLVLVISMSYLLSNYLDISEFRALLLFPVVNFIILLVFIYLFDSELKKKLVSLFYRAN